jgi:hypothetical protein
VRPGPGFGGSGPRGASTIAIPREARPTVRPALTPAVWGAPSLAP